MLLEVIQAEHTKVPRLKPNCEIQLLRGYAER